MTGRNLHGGKSEMTKVNLLAILVFSISPSKLTYAACEKQRLELQEWSQKCERLTHISELGATVGGLLAVPTHGISLAPCAAAYVSAEIACNVKASLERELEQCESAGSRTANSDDTSLAALSTAQIQKSEFYKIYLPSRELLQAEYESQLITLIEEYALEGESSASLTSQESFDQARAGVEQEYREKLRLLGQYP
jgi:hypothetical protein